MKRLSVQGIVCRVFCCDTLNIIKENMEQLRAAAEDNSPLKRKLSRSSAGPGWQCGTCLHPDLDFGKV